jgi:Predicted permeases
MNLLDRYLGKAIMAGTLMALLMVIGLEFIFALVEEVDDLGKGTYGILDALLYVILTLPRRIYELFPMMVLVGSLLGLGGLAGNSELVVIRAAGVSLARIVWSVMKTGLVLFLVASSLGEVVAPESERLATTLRAEAQHKSVALQSDFGLWARNGRMFIHARQLLPEGQLGDLLVFRFDDHHQLKSTFRAALAHYEAGRWHLQRVSGSRLDDNRIDTWSEAETAMDSLLNPELVKVVVVRPERLSAWDLHTYIRYLRDNGLATKRYELAFWIKLVAPCATLVMLLLAIPFVFGPLRSVGAGQRLLVGALVGMGFYVVNQALNHMGVVYGMNPFLSASLPALVFLAVGLWFIRRIA